MSRKILTSPTSTGTKSYWTGERWSFRLLNARAFTESEARGEILRIRRSSNSETEIYMEDAPSSITGELSRVSLDPYKLACSLQVHIREMVRDDYTPQQILNSVEARVDAHSGVPVVLVEQLPVKSYSTGPVVFMSVDRHTAGNFIISHNI